MTFIHSEPDPHARPDIEVFHVAAGHPDFREGWYWRPRASGPFATEAAAAADARGDIPLCTLSKPPEEIEQ